MQRFDARTRLFAAGLAALAGYLDAVGFIGSGGFFVSFMSGNSTRLAVGIADRSEAALLAGGLIGSFLLGAVVAGLVKRLPLRRKERSVLALVALSLTAAALLVGAELAIPGFMLVAFAMGAVNLVFEADGDVRIGLTYMTGTLVKLGSRIAAALTGQRDTGWLALLLQWLALVGGAACGAVAFGYGGGAAIWVAVALAWVLLAAKLLGLVRLGTMAA